MNYTNSPVYQLFTSQEAQSQCQQSYISNIDKESKCTISNNASSPTFQILIKSQNAQSQYDILTIYKSKVPISVYANSPIFQIFTRIKRNNIRLYKQSCISTIYTNEKVRSQIMRTFKNSMEH